MVMKYSQLFLILIPFFIISCSSTHRLKKESADEFAEQFNALSQDKKTEISEITQVKYKAQNVRLSSDSVYWTNLKDNSIRVSKIGRISQIRFTDSGKGALEGMGIGLLAGFSTGAVIDYASGDDRSFVSATAVLVTLGSILGFIIGAASGHEDIFILNDPQDYYPLVNAKIVEESADTIRLLWNDKTVCTNKSEIFIKQKGRITIIYVPKKIIENLLLRESGQRNE
jgi:hypothetical protein